MAGSTAVAYQPGPGGSRLIVGTNGGMSMPPAGGVQSGKVLKVRSRGHALKACSQFEASQLESG